MRGLLYEGQAGAGRPIKAPANGIRRGTELMNIEPSMVATLLAQGDAMSLADGLLKAWHLALVVIGFSVVILFHELGHFAAAKWAGVKVEKFAIGFGPELVGLSRGETRYAINILPLGGYVKMLGQDDASLDKQKEWELSSDPRSFTGQSVGKRALIVSAGVLMNLLFTAVAFVVVFMVGMDSVPAKVGIVLPNTPAQRGGLAVGDAIHRINGRKMDDFQDVMMSIALADKDQPLTFELERDGQPMTLSIPPEFDEGRGLLQVGIGPSMTRVVDYVGPAMTAMGSASDVIQVGDTITKADGQPIADRKSVV